MNEDEARRSGLPLSIGGAFGDGSGRSMSRSEDITGRPERAETVPAREQRRPEPVEELPDVPEREPEPVPQTLAPQDVPVASSVIIVPVKTLEEQIADAKKLLGDLGMDVVDRSDPAAAPVIPEEPSIEESFYAALKRPCSAYRAWRATVDFSKILWGFIERTQAFLFFGAIAFLGLLDAANTIDIRAAIKLMTGWEEERVGNFLVAMSILGLLLRMIVTTPSFDRWRRRSRGDGYARGIGTGYVDEPV